MLMIPKWYSQKGIPNLARFVAIEAYWHEASSYCSCLEVVSSMNHLSIPMPIQKLGASGTTQSAARGISSNGAANT